MKYPRDARQPPIIAIKGREQQRDAIATIASMITGMIFSSEKPLETPTTERSTR
jgi:hypothetical protein